MSPQQESQLLSDARTGDRKAFESLIDPLRRPLFAYIYRMTTNPQDAEDLAQDTLVRVLESLPQHQVLDDIQFRAASEAIATLNADTQTGLEDRTAMHALLRYQLCALILRLRLLNASQHGDATSPTSAQRRFERFKTLLEANYLKWHMIDPYAEALGCTQKSLNRATQGAMGRNAKDLIAHRLILESKRLLVHTDQAVYQIAEGLGFDEPTNFSKFFRRYAKQSPGQFRKAYRN